ncbi:amino acid or sugar ABC transport system, permease protein, putative [Candidatus Moduliflexus flocculans]|uniref:Amino acid or sugar ABC transport system, permease protein, putative n=1 Tax=Candidatus Moduliflexus flocculans TaxID=1499966 RepID=A0A0S6VYL5_9BACT|nr:amino acid or sugar ABC transport system, permease protein, putative [Candidatus Moduliflexus flocculans]
MLENRQHETEKDQRVHLAHGKKRQIPTVYYTLALIVVVGLLFSLGNANFISAYNLNTIASFGAILLMVALGQMCAIIIGGIDLSVGGVMSFVSVVFVKIVPTAGYWAYPLCILIGMFIGYINGNILTRIKIPSFIATLGTGGILMSLAMLVAPVPVNVPADFWGILDVFNTSFLKISNAVVISLLIFLIYYIILRFTLVGRNIFYVGSNIKMSWMSGINVVKTRNVAFMLSGMGAALAGIMVSATSLGSNPYVGAPYIMNSVASVVVGGTALTGGIGSAVNTLCGALLLSVLQNGMNVVGIDQYFQQSVLGIMIIISVVLTFDRSKTPVIK